MTIKQLEQELELPRATIRFYEKENLIAPKRGENSYREYSSEDVATLKKIIVLRKIGLSVADIKDALEGKTSLQELLEKNIVGLQEKMKELEGAINVSKKMQIRNEDMNGLDEELYWNEIRVEEKAGNRFLDIVNDVVAFEKGVILKEFELVNEEGQRIYGIKESIFRALGMCVLIGVLWFVLEGKERTVHDFIEGFFWPFICIIITSCFGLPLHFLGKKHPKAAGKIRKVGMILAGVLVILLLVLAIVLGK